VGNAAANSVGWNIDFHDNAVVCTHQVTTLYNACIIHNKYVLNMHVPLQSKDDSQHVQSQTHHGQQFQPGWAVFPKASDEHALMACFERRWDNGNLDPQTYNFYERSTSSHKNICMYVCTYVRMYVWTYECMNVWMYECMNVWMYECMYVCKCMMYVWCMYMYVYVCICMYMYVNVCRCYVM